MGKKLQKKGKTEGKWGMGLENYGASSGRNDKKRMWGK